MQFFLVLFVATTGGQIFAQETATKVVPPSATKPENETKEHTQRTAAQPSHPSGRIQYVGPDTYILLDSEGRPQPVPGMTYEDFLAAWKKQNRAANPESQPRFTIEGIKIDGQTHGQRAELKFGAVVHILADGPVDVPLGLVGAIVQGDARFGKSEPDNQKVATDQQRPKSKSEDQYLYYDSQHGGFVARMNGHAADRQTLSLNLVVPLTRDGAETTLPLNIPRSVSSSLTLDIDTSIVEARTSGGTVLAQKPLAEGGARIEVAGPTGQFRLTWQSANNPESMTILNAVGAIRITIDGRGLRSDARLTVNSIGGTFDHFRVRLPQGTKLVLGPTAAGTQDPKYRISEEAPGSKTAAESAAKVVLVELKEKQQGPVVVDLSTEQLTAQVNAGQPLELAGFEVLGAVRQFGDIALNVANDWQARWDLGPYVRQVDRTELDNSLQRSDLTAAFQYDRQPWSLGVRVSPRQSRVYVKPKYELELLPEEARLNVQLAYQVFGARAFEFRVELDGWEMSGEPLESGGLVDQDRIAVTPEGTLLLPLTQASSRKSEVSFSLRRKLGRDVSRIQLPLPAPLADSVGSGELKVHAAPGIELLPDLANSTGLALAPTGEATAAPAIEDATVIHFRSLLPSAVFAATRTNRGRQAAAQVATQVEIAADSAQVDQRIEYVVRYEPIKELVFETGSDFPLAAETLEIALLSSGDENSELAEQRTPFRFEAIADENESPETDARRLRVALPQPRVGKFVVSVRYRMPRPQLGSRDGALSVPLLSPVDGHVNSERAIVRVPKGNAVALNTRAESSSWKANEPQRKNNTVGTGHEFVADRAEISLPLVVSAVEPNVASTTIVERVWLQTWLSSEVEQDRVAFRFRTTGSQTTVELPPDISPSDVEVLVDGRPGDVSSPAAGRIVIRLPHSQNAGDVEDVLAATYTLELRFRHPIQQALITRHLLTPPQIDGVSELSQIYWQIVLPADEHIVQSPNQLMSASEWQWLGSFWGRRSPMSQSELEQWVNASTQLAPSSADNEYLFTGLLPISTIALVTAPRWLIVLVASSTALALVTGFFYLPSAARPWMLIAIIFVIAAAAIAYPTAALLIAQAAAIGMVLAPLSALISRLMRRPDRWTPSSSVPASSQRTLTPRTDSIVMPPVIATASTAPTASLRLSDSAR